MHLDREANGKNVGRREVRSSERARRVKILEETGAQGVQAAVLGLRGGASEVEAVLTLVRGVRAL